MKGKADEEESLRLFQDCSALRASLDADWMS